MPYYGPHVLPESYGTDAGQHLAQALLDMDERKRRDRIDQEEQTDREIRRQQQGVRRGTAPVEAPQTVTIPDVPTFGAPDPATLGRVLSGGGFVGGLPTEDAPWMHSVANGGTGVEEGGITGRMGAHPGAFDPVSPGTFSAPTDLGLGQQGDVASSRNKAQTHPGAFDPATRSFGGSPLQQAIAQQHATGGGRTLPLANSSPRYQQIDDAHYLDLTQTPAAEHERERMSELEFQRSLRGEDRADAATAALAERQRKITALVAAGVDPQRAALYAEMPTLAANDPTFGTPKAPVMGSPAWVKAQEDAARVKAKFRPPAQEPLVKIEDPASGEVTYVPRSQAVGKAAPTTAAGGAQAAKSRAYADLMEQAMPTMESLSEKVRPTRISFAVAHPTIGNYGLNQDEQLYMEAARNFLAGALHLESGARLSKEQWAIGMQRFLPTAGDSPETKAFKLAAARQVATDRRKEAGGGTPSAGGSPAAGGAADPFADLIPKGGRPPDLE
jgi:hypothetical protein